MKKSEYKSKSLIKNPSKQQLANRLYDQGFSHYTMPSVQRHGNLSLQKKPIVARLYSINNTLIKEVKQPQTSILYTKDNTSKVNEETMQQVYDNQMNFGYTTMTALNRKTEKQQSQFLEGKPSNIWNVEEARSRIGLEPVRMSNATLIRSVDRNMSKEGLRQFNDYELKQSHFVIDKLRENYLDKTKYYRTKAKTLTPISQTTSQTIRAAVKQDESYKRKNQGDLDAYINLILKGSVNVDEFVYLVKNPESDDPYDLILKNYFQIPGVKQKKNQNDAKGDFYTISAKGLCRYKEGRPVEFIGLNEWLKERETYDRIKGLGFFSDFLKWKTVKMWRRSYQSFKKKVAAKNLEEKLFLSYPELREAVLNTKQVLYEMSQLNFLDVATQKDGQQDAVPISSFVRQQEHKAHKTQSAIHKYSKNTHEIYTRAVETRLDILRNEVSMANDQDHAVKRELNQPFLRLQDNPYESLGFPDNMSYDKRSVLRKECLRFIRLAYLIDFMALNNLIGVYCNTVRSFIEETSELSALKDPLILTDMEKTKPVGFRDPLFNVNVQASLDFSNKDIIVDYEEVPDYKPPKQDDDNFKPEDFKDYNLLTYPFTIDYDCIDDFNEQQKRFLEYGEQWSFKRAIARDIELKCLQLEPSIDDFNGNIDKILTEGIGALQAFSSFAKHANIKKYQAILEEWEDNETELEQAEDLVLNPDEWMDPDMKFLLEKQLKGVFASEFEKATLYLQTFSQYLQISWEYSQLDYDKLVSLQLARPQITYTAGMNLLEHHKTVFETKIPYQADIGLFRINSADLKKLLLPQAKDVLETLSMKIPPVIENWLERSNNWLEESSQKLKSNIDNVRMFVNISQDVKDIEKKFSYYKNLIKTAKEIMDTVRKFQVDMGKRIPTLYTECKNQEQFLTSQLIMSTENLTKNQEVFSKEIRVKAVPELESSCGTLEIELKDTKLVSKVEVNAYTNLLGLRDRVKDYKERARELNSFQDVLGLAKTKFENLTTINDDVETKILLWESSVEWTKLVQGFNEAPFTSINVEAIQQSLEQYQRNVSKIRKLIPLTNEMLADLDTNIKTFAALIPVIVALRNDKLTRNHFNQIEEIIEFKLDLEHIKLKDLLTDKVLDQQKKIIAVSVQVTQEANLKLQLDEIDQRYGELIFPLKSFKEDSPKDSTYILDDCTDLMTEVDKLIVMINNVYGSRYLLEYKKQAADKRKDILILQDLLVEWIKFQKNYIYLESIFSQPEIKKPLQIEVKEFEDSVNKVYKQNMKKIMVIQSVAQLNKQKYIEQYYLTFKKHNDILAELNKKINNFLDSKREAFPRFYFVANDELIQILANYDNPVAVQGFVGKLFENINRVDFGPDPRSLSIQGIISREGEVLPLKSTVNIKADGVDKWMKKLEELMMETLFRVIREGLNNYGELSKEDWYLTNTAQVTSIISQIAWVVSVEDYLKSIQDGEQNTIDETLSDTNRNLDILTELVRRPLSSAVHKSIVALITAEVHNRDLIELLGQRNVQSVNDFIWQQQLRHCYDEGADMSTAITIKQINGVQRYGYEYYGPASRIVITPLTDRCWMTITSALHMKLGAAPAGPAGTGKTESTKDLAKSLARFCLVFNCSEQIDCIMMEKLFRGVIQQGAWTCLDEFNRIDIEVLSVVAQQLLEMRLALLKYSNNSEFFFCGGKCVLKDTCGVFITMNPGYAGRTELPENLKALFRPISMMIPDYGLIAQILLFSEGFKESKLLAMKMVRLYKLASEQLSQQKHYDFGMRAVKSVLEMAGKLKREMPDAPETDLLIKALKDSNVPKFLKPDAPLFNALVVDLFPGVVIKDEVNHQLVEKIVSTMEEKGLQPREAFVTKATQLYETLNVRFGTMIVGTAMTGKTTVLYSLIDALNALKTSKLSKNPLYNGVTCVRINPKSVTMGELYGEENQITKDWQDGLASYYMRTATTNEAPGSHWICFDGPVDSLWIENMNSVLDDSRLLCLANGQRIRLKPDMRVLIEVDSLEQASPATVSRCGMVYMSSEVLTCQDLIDSWMRGFCKVDYLTEDQITHVKELCEAHLSVFAEYYQILVNKFDIVPGQCVLSVFNIIEAVLNPAYGFNIKGSPEYISEYINLAFIFASAWGFAATLQGKDSEKLDNLIKKKFPNSVFPADSIINCLINTEQATFELYSANLKEFEFDKDKSFWDILVPTIDTMKLSHVMDLYVNKGKNIFLTGDSGTGKSVLVSTLLKSYYTTKNIDTLSFNFSAQTNSKTVQDTIISSLFLLSQKSRGAKFGRKNILYVDDVNMPSLETYGAQPPIELLRQLIDQSLMYDRAEMFPVQIVDTSLIILAAPPEGGRNKLTPRFSRHFNMLNFSEARNTSIGRIFDTIMSNYLVNFEESIKTTSHNIVNAAIEFYEKILVEKLPTPAKFHYTFNLRDLSRVFMGLAKANKEEVKDQKHLIRLWGHEMSRIFYDRLINQEDREWFDKTIGKISENYLRIRAEDLNLHKTIFNDLFSIGEAEEVYEEITDMKKIVKSLEDHQLDYNDRNRNKLNLVFFQEAVEHILRIIRILRQDRGYALLMGIGGLGKNSLARLSAFICKLQIVEYESTKVFKVDKFSEWLRKKVLLECAGYDAGLNGKPLCFLLNDSQINNDKILEDINSLLNSGEVPNIFPVDERQKLEKMLIDMYAEKNVTISVNDIWKTFVERVRKSLHIVLCMSPIGDALKVWCRKFPGLVNNCTIDWFEQWSGTALQSVAFKILEDKNIEKLESVCSLIKDFFMHASNSAAKFTSEMQRRFFITPKLALDNVSLFVELLNKKTLELDEAKKNFSRGSIKLEDMAVIVERLKIEITEAQPQLKIQSRLASEKLVELEVASKAANEKKQMVEKEASAIQIKTEQIEIINSQATCQLEKALPKIQKAENEVRNIDRKELNTLRHLNSPPAMIEFIFSTVCVALGEKYTNWKATGIKMLNDLAKFVDMLIEKIDRIKTEGSSVIPPATLAALKKNLASEYFSDAKLETNVIAKPLGLWCKAIYDFASLKKQIEPLEKNAKEMSEKLAEAQKEYNAIAAELDECRKTFQQLQDEFNGMEKRKKDLEENIAFSKIKLDRAEQLTSLLFGEGKRWAEAVKHLEAKDETLLTDVFMSTAMISYMGPLTSTYRAELFDQFKESLQAYSDIKLSEKFNFTSIIGDALTIKDWCANGLPSDYVSQCSGLFAIYANKWAMLIDPQQQANKWLKAIHGSSESFIVVKSDMPEKKFNDIFKTALSNGYTLLLEDCEETLNSSLDTVISRAWFVNQLDQRVLINFNEELVSFHENFKLFMTTKVSNPKFLPDVFIRTNVINFTVTQKGLEDQLLAEVMKLEKPEVENLKNQNIDKIGLYNRKMQELEKQILKLLVECESSPVEDENLLKTLKSSKKTAEEVKAKMESIEKIDKELELTREQYRSIATRGSILFFVVADLCSIDSMYQYSFQYIVKLFKAAIRTTEDNTTNRYSSLISNITKTIYKNVSRGVFEEHKMILSFLIAIDLDLKTNQLPQLKWELFLKGSGVIDRSGQIHNPNPNLFSDYNWDLLTVLERNFVGFQGLQKDMTVNLDTWEKYSKSKNLYNEPLPAAFEPLLNKFDRLFILKVLRPELMLEAINAYIVNKIGSFYIDNIESRIEDIYEDSDRQTPIVFILSKGADPSSIIKRFGKDKGFHMYERLQPISLGQGQGIRASRLIEQGMIDGHWVLLENCHLARTWMPELEKIIEKLQNRPAEDIHSDFRLYLTSMPASYFPVSILQNSIKITTEPPRGMKANVARSLNRIEQEQIDKVPMKENIGKLIMSLCVFHALVQERRKFGPLGWNIAYEFNDSDFDVAADVLVMFMDKIENRAEIPWDSLVFLAGMITYGGRVTDDQDRRLLLTMINKYFSDSVLDDRFKFSADEIYKMPKSSDKAVYLNYVQNFHGTDNPELFGLHQNANISYQSQETQKIIQTIIMVMPKAEVGGGNHTTVTKVQDMIAQFLSPEALPENIDPSTGHKELFMVQENGLIPSLSTVLIQEIDRFNKLIDRIRQSLKQLNSAIQGTTAMSAKLDQIFNSLLNNKVPEYWAEISYPSLKPLSSWFNNLIQRIAFINSWLQEGHLSHYWLPGFFFPQGFLTGVLQTHARKLNESIDKFQFTFKATDFDDTVKAIAPPEDGVYISGLFLEGGWWDKKRKALVDQPPNQRFYKMPYIHFIPKEQNDFKGNIYSCPLYKTLVRAGTLSTTGQSTNFILEVLLPCDKMPDVWVCRGVALFCELDD